MRDQILEDLKNAMKARDKEKLSVIRMVKGSMQLAELDKKRNLTDDEMIALIAKEIKTREESIKEFEKGNREDLIEKTQKEIDILKEYLPEELSDEEVNKIIDEAFKKINPTSIKDMGKIMKEISPKVRGRYDMSKLSSLVKDKLK